jgi:cell division protease FtsH
MELFPDGLYGATIIPQGESSGHVEFAQSESVTKRVTDLQNEIAVAIAGRVAENECLGETYLGCSSDMKRGLSIAMRLVTVHATRGYKYAIKKHFGYNESPLSEQTKREIEVEAEKYLESAEEQARKIIKDNYAKFLKIVDLLTEKKFLSREELLAVYGEFKSVA